MPVWLRLCNYYQDQENDLAGIVSKLNDAGTAYSNPTSPWASAPVLDPKPGPDEF